MTQGSHDIEQRLAELRSAFDDAFASPPVQVQQDAVEFLVVSVGDQAYALRISELAGLEANRKIVPMPLEVPGLLGLCAVAGQLVPVFGLGAILGADGRKESAPWMVLYRDRELIGLAFDEFQGTRRVAAHDVHHVELIAQQVHLTPRAIQVDGCTIHVVDLAAVAVHIRQSIHPQ